MQSDEHLQLAQAIGGRYAKLLSVEAVALGGSIVASASDSESDIDLYVYVTESLPLAERRRIATESASQSEVDNQFWEPGDEWIDAATGIHVDVMFRSPGWIEDQVDRVLTRHEASVGYSTCFWHNVRVSHALFDRSGWFVELQERASQPYPDELRTAIIDRNYPILRDTLSSYRHQLERAIARRDLVSINHRIAAFLASYFDILFALNRQTHPGEKRLMTYIAETCDLKPRHLDDLIETMLDCRNRDGTESIHLLDQLVDHLDELLRRDKLR